jgi:hypothetical protein
MKTYISYDSTTGRIDNFYGLTDASLAVQTRDMIEVPPNYLQAIHYVEDGVLVPRSTLNATWSKTTITANGVDTAVLSGLPDPCTVMIDGEAHEVTGGSLEFAASSPGVYRISIDEVQYLPETWEVIANE